MELKGGRGMWHVDMHVCTLCQCAVVHFDPVTGSGGSMMRMNVRILACIACALATCCVGVAMAREPSEEDQEPNDAITCKLAGNKDPKLDCWPMCVCQKFAWTLEFQPHLRQEIKTTKICENWVEKEVMKPECMVVCASISHAVYGAQGTDPNVCQHAAHEVEMVAGGKGEKLDYKEKFKEVGATFLRKNDNHAAKVVKNKKWESLVGKAKWMPKVKPDQKFMVGK